MIVLRVPSAFLRSPREMRFRDSASLPILMVLTDLDARRMTIAEETGLLVATRRDLHRHPELGFQEHRTAGIAAERLRAAGYEVQTGLAVTGVVGTLRGGAGDGPTLLLRADMDALPIAEECGHDFVSGTAGVMHACGHDAHVA